MALKIKRAGEAEYGHFIKALVVGDPGSGKTRTASTWPNVLYANVEGGLMSVADRNPAYVDIVSTSELKELLRTLKQSPAVRESEFGIPVDTVVLDTFDEIAKMFMIERVRSTGHDFQRDDWGWLGDELRGILRGYRNLDVHVVVNVHMKTEEDQQTGATVYKPNIQGAVGGEIAAYFDLAMLMRSRVETIQKGQTVERVVKRYFQTYPDLQHPWIKDRSGHLPSEVEVNFEDDFARMHKDIYAVVPEGGEDIVTLSSPAPVITPPPAKKAAAKKAATKKAAPAAAAPPQPTLPAEDPAPAPQPEQTDEVNTPSSTPDAQANTLQVTQDEVPVPETTVEAPEADTPVVPDVEASADDPELAAPPTEVPVDIATEPEDIPDGMFHSATCPKGKTLCTYDPEITPISEVRYTKGPLCRQCFADERRAD